VADQLVSVAQALHWFGRDRFFAEVQRIARPRALLAAYGYSWFYLTPILDALTDRWLLLSIPGQRDRRFRGNVTGCSGGM
jgi:hypothetical protein